MSPRDNTTDQNFEDISANDGSLNIVDAEEVSKMTPEAAFKAGEQFGEEIKNRMQNIAIEVKAAASDTVKPIGAPPPKKKIAILGTTPTWQAAPFDDPSWEIWGIFGVALASKRLTRLYELHNKSIIEPMVKQYSPDGRYWAVAKALGPNFITRDAYAETPDATRFDFAAKMERYGKYFASSASWLMADAIDQDPAEIAIFGINMAADEEYAHQKPSLSFMIGWAKAKGIKITIPSSSELMSLTHQYGLEDPPRFFASLAQRKHEVNQSLQIHKSQLLTAQLQCANAEGAMAQLQWFEQNFSAENKAQAK